MPDPIRTQPLRQLADNLVSGYAYLAFAALVTLLLVPVYVHALGPMAWGAVAWCLTLQGVLFSLDAAVGPLVLRDVARAADAGGVRAAYMRFLRVYGGVALGAFALGQLAAFALAAEVRLAVRLALVQFAFQFANNAANGVWYALQRQRTANLRLAGFAALKHAFALLLVLAWQPTPVAFLLPFALIAALEFALNRRRVLREHHAAALGLVAETQWRQLAGFGAAAVIGLASAHIDRIVLALRAPVAAYGEYFLLCSLLLALLHLQLPLQRIFLPRMATADTPHATARALLKLSIPLLVLPCLLLAAFAEPLLRLWLHDDAIAARGAGTLQLLCIAAALFVLAAPTGLLLLRQGRWRTLAAINTAMLVSQSVALWLLVPRIGTQAGAYAWLAAACVQLACAWPVWRRAG